MAASRLVAVVKLKSGEQNFRQEINLSNSKETNPYTELRTNIKKLQTDVNVFLTQQIELEKVDNQLNAASQNRVAVGSTAVDSDESEDEGDLDDETNKETKPGKVVEKESPPFKKQKT